jgi:hypothetical protein
LAYAYNIQNAAISMADQSDRFSSEELTAAAASRGWCFAGEF